MKKVLLAIFITTTIVACKQKDKPATETGYTIVGKITGTETGTAIVLQKLLQGSNADTAYVAKDGSFTFKGSVAEPTAAAIFTAETLQKDISPLTLFIEPSNTSVTGDKATINIAKVEGGKSNDDLKKVEDIMQGYFKKMKPLGDSMRVLYDTKQTAAIKPLQAEYLHYEKQQKADIMQFVKANPKSYASAFFAYQFNSYNTDIQVAETAFNNLDATIQTSFFGKKLKTVVDALKATGIGGLAPDFTLQTPDGKNISLSSLKGKYVLIDFWASWCAPCRQENPNVVKAFNQFKDKNFTILGVSLDEDKAAWQQAIMKDNLTWQHVSDLQGWNSKVAAQYSVQGIPANFLLDTNGKIIAKNLRAEDLLNKLSEVLR